MRKRERQTTLHDRGKWFAPPSGGYSGLGPNGEVIKREGLPPKVPATAAGVKDSQARHKSAGPES